MKKPTYKKLRHSIALAIVLPALLTSCRACKPTAAHAHQPPQPDTPQRPQRIQLLICTANAYSFKQPAADQLVKTIAALRQPDDDVIIFGFQETSASHQAQHFSKHLPQFSLFHDGSGCSNTIAILAKQHPTVHSTILKLPQQHTATPDRFALLLDLPDWGISIATTHLTGGKYDDQHWMHFTDGRIQQLATILQHQPTVLMGDFNADSHFQEPLAAYWQKLLKKAPDKTLDDLRQYNTGAHQYLTQQGYATAIDRGALTRTTPYGTVVDWIYVSSQKHTYAVKAWGTVPGISQNLSDHDFPWVRLEIKLAS